MILNLYTAGRCFSAVSTWRIVSDVLSTGTSPPSPCQAPTPRPGPRAWARFGRKRCGGTGGAGVTRTQATPTRMYVCMYLKNNRDKHWSYCFDSWLLYSLNIFTYVKGETAGDYSRHFHRYCECDADLGESDRGVVLAERKIRKRNVLC